GRGLGALIPTAPATGDRPSDLFFPRPAVPVSAGQDGVIAAQPGSRTSAAELLRTRPDDAGTTATGTDDDGTDNDGTDNDGTDNDGTDAETADHDAPATPQAAPAEAGQAELTPVPGAHF